MAENAKPEEPESLQVEQPDRQMCCARFSSCGALLAAGGLDGLVRLWRVGGADTEEVPLFPLPAISGHQGWVSDLAFHPARPLLFSADTWGRLRCHDWENDPPSRVWERADAHDGWIHQIAVNDSHVATVGRDRALRVWTLEGECLCHHQTAEPLFTLAFHPDAATRQVVFGDLKGGLRVLDFSSNTIVREFDGSRFHTLDRIQDVGGLRQLRILEIDGELSLLAAGSIPTKGATMQGTPTLQIYNFETGEPGGKIEHGQPKDGFIEDLAIHPSGYLMAVTSGVPGSGFFFCIRPGEDKPFHITSKLSNLHAIALHPDSRRIAITATSKGSNGNGRRVDKDGNYVGNHSPLHFFELPDWTDA